MAARTVAATAKSTSDTATAENGKISRGKYTLVTMFVFAVNDVTANRSAEAVKFQASSPQYANKGYGTRVSTGATRMKITEKMMVFDVGLRSAHPSPIAVCL